MQFQGKKTTFEDEDSDGIQETEEPSKLVDLHCRYGENQQLEIVMWWCTCLNFESSSLQVEIPLYQSQSKDCIAS